jgi:hypothetical protein
VKHSSALNLTTNSQLCGVPSQEVSLMIMYHRDHLVYCDCIRGDRILAKLDALAKGLLSPRCNLVFSLTRHLMHVLHETDYDLATWSMVVVGCHCRYYQALSQPW